MASNKSLITTIIYGGISLLSLSLFVYYFFYRPQQSVPLVENVQTTETLKEVEIEDVDESDEENGSEDGDVTESKEKNEGGMSSAELKEAYDTAVRVAQKFIKAEEHLKAAEKLSEAIKLASQVPSVSSKDLIALYNNRSAMNEKAKSYEEALRDIRILLTMDPSHVKARMRRARIYEVQGKLKLALVDLFFCTFRDPALQQDMGHARKLETLVKQLASARATDIIQQMLKGPENGERPLPSHAFVRNALEAYMCLPAWRQSFGVERKEELLQIYDSVRGSETVTSVQAGLDVVRYHFVHNDIRHSFTVLKELAALLPAMEAALENGADESTKDAAFHLYEFLGFHAQMLGDHNAAAALYDKAISIDPHHLFVQLKRASVYLEFNDVAAAQQLYATLLEMHKEDVDQAWICFHSSSLYINRDANGSFPTAAEDALQHALADLELALAHTEKSLEEEAPRLVHFNVLLKISHLRSHVKAQMGLQPTEEDAAAVKEVLHKAKSLYPHHDSLVILEASRLADSGEFDKAIDLVDKHCHRPDNTLDPASALVIKASVFAAKAFMIMANPQSQLQLAEAERIFREEVCQYYEKALSTDPQSLEVLCQYAQTKSMLGDTAGCVHLLHQASPLVKGRDEAFDIAPLMVQSEAQFAAMQELIAAQQ